MPVAVRLIELFTLVTLLGILTCCSLLVVVAQRLAFLVFLFVSPLTQGIHCLLTVSEHILVGTLNCLLSITNSISENM